MTVVVVRSSRNEMNEYFQMRGLQVSNFGNNTIRCKGDRWEHDCARHVDVTGRTQKKYFNPKSIHPWQCWSEAGPWQGGLPQHAIEKRNTVEFDRESSKKYSRAELSEPWEHRGWISAETKFSIISSPYLSSPSPPGICLFPAPVHNM